MERDLEVIFPSKEEYLKAIEIMISLLKIGKPIPVIDAMIAAICITRGLTLVTRDKHFQIVKKLFPEFKLELKS